MGCGVAQSAAAMIQYNSNQLLKKKKLTDAFLHLMIRFIIKYWKKNNKNT